MQDPPGPSRNEIVTSLGLSRSDVKDLSDISCVHMPLPPVREREREREMTMDNQLPAVMST